MDRRPMNGNRRPLTPEEKRRMISQMTPEQKRRILERRRRRRMKKRLMVIVPAALVLIVALILILTLTGGKGEDKVQEQPEAVSALAQIEAGMPDPTEAVATPTPAPTPTPVPIVYDTKYVQAMKDANSNTGRVIAGDYSRVEASKRSRYPEDREGYLPIIRSAVTSEKIIAVTVDDCYQGENLRQIVECAVNNNAKLTIFPIGENLTKQPIANAVKYAYQSGMELGNHTYNHIGMFGYDDERMTNELYYQDRAVDELLGVDYQMHFFRPRGGDERNDQRVHAYVEQMGYDAIALWNKDGSKTPINDLVSNIQPGDVYLFHTTDNDLNLLLQFIPAAVQQGYTLVTMSDMFGLPKNEEAPLTPTASKPPLQDFRIRPIYLENTTYARAALLVQQRLIDLGWLEGTADGIYGKSSHNAIGYFQKMVGLEATGDADEATQRALFADDAPRGSEQIKKELKKKK